MNQSSDTNTIVYDLAPESESGARDTLVDLEPYGAWANSDDDDSGTCTNWIDLPELED